MHRRGLGTWPRKMETERRGETRDMDRKGWGRGGGGGGGGSREPGRRSVKRSIYLPKIDVIWSSEILAQHGG